MPSKADLHQRGSKSHLVNNQGREAGRGYFTVLNSLTDTRDNPLFGCFMSLGAAGSDLNEKA